MFCSGAFPVITPLFLPLQTVADTCGSSSEHKYSHEVPGTTSYIVLANLAHTARDA